MALCSAQARQAQHIDWRSVILRRVSSKLSTCSMLSSNGRSLSWIFDSLSPTCQVPVFDGSSVVVA